MTSAKKHWCWVGQIYFFQCFGNHKPSSVCFHYIPWLFALALLSSSSFKAPATLASKLCRSNLRIKLRKVHRTHWHVGRNLKTDVCRCSLPAAEGGGAGDSMAVIVLSGEWQQQQGDHLILLKLGSSIAFSRKALSAFLDKRDSYVCPLSFLSDGCAAEWMRGEGVHLEAYKTHALLCYGCYRVCLAAVKEHETDTRQSVELIATIIKSRVILPEVIIHRGM